mmetsp:Transcript_10514/g.27026  ORF Transcript_10514/g.27026 Transcript_10514/m.27026 type:complete len:200 (+) Transcript_10514:169-768(+)
MEEVQLGGDAGGGGGTVAQEAVGVARAEGPPVRGQHGRPAAHPARPRQLVLQHRWWRQQEQAGGAVYDGGRPHHAGAVERRRPAHAVAHHVLQRHPAHRRHPAGGAVHLVPVRRAAHRDLRRQLGDRWHGWHRGHRRRALQALLPGRLPRHHRRHVWRRRWPLLCHHVLRHDREVRDDAGRVRRLLRLRVRAAEPMHQG